MRKQVNIAQLVDNASAQLEAKKQAAKERRMERKATQKSLQRGTSSNRTYNTKIPGAAISVRWINGIQQCSIDYNNSEEESEVEEVVVNLPSIKMTWKKLRAEVIAGNSVYTRAGKKIPCTKRAETMPNKEVKVTVESIGKTKIYRIT